MSISYPFFADGKVLIHPIAIPALLPIPTHIPPPPMPAGMRSWLANRRRLSGDSFGFSTGSGRSSVSSNGNGV
ncbi:unnamed protein product [Enterobius vermicularis]|uniref:Secreted peptide n=1 Tax=Enterobius vermicularis TaxID=51028 RepID=A0A0N4VDV5_ENTVE|nr:unnamed protein product [Enterobius vermicularis]